MRVITILFLIPGLLVLFGCVSIGTFKKKMAECEKVQEERNACVGEIKGLKRVAEDVEEENTANLEEFDYINAIYDDLYAAMEEELKDELINLEVIDYSVVVSLGQNAILKPGQTILQEKGKKLLDTFAVVFRKYKDIEIRVEGHTDSSIAKGKLKQKYPTNWELASARSGSVVKYLQGRGVSPENLVLVSHSEYRPISDNAGKEGRQKNRRIEIIVVKKETN